MRSPHFSLSLTILLLPLLSAALPQEPDTFPISDPTTTTSTSTSTLYVTRTLIRGTSVVTAILPDSAFTDIAQATSSLPDISDPEETSVPSDILVAAPYPSSTGASSVSGVPSGTGVVKPSGVTTGPAIATFTGAAAPQSAGITLAAMGMAMAVMGALL